ncbi:hypothetical protein BHE74_00030467 [Ensete ventricosum]|nr:hypothetical protein BHE74_00030467 [Ensete ventricosum]
MFVPPFSPRLLNATAWDDDLSLLPSDSTALKAVHIDDVTLDQPPEPPPSPSPPPRPPASTKVDPARLPHSPCNSKLERQ